MKKTKLAIGIAALMVFVVLFPTAAFAFSQETGNTVVSATAAPPSGTPKPTATPAPTPKPPVTPNPTSETNTSLSIDAETLGTMLSGLDKALVGTLKEHPQLLSLLLPTLHVTVREGTLTITTGKKETSRTGTVVTQGGVLNVRTNPGVSNSIITTLLNGTSVKVLGEKNGWYQIEIPSGFGYVCGEYLRVNDIPSMQTGDGYSFDIDGMTLLSFLQLFDQTADGSSQGLTPTGNLSLVDDLGRRNGAGQQFITMVTKSGNYFYLIIDRDEKGQENVHFLNMVDERDLFSLMDEDDTSEYKAQLAALQEAREAAEKAAEAAAAAQAASSENPKKEQKKSSIGPVLLVVLLMAAGGGAWFYLQTKKKQAAPPPDPDADYPDDDDEDYGSGQSQAGNALDPYGDEFTDTEEEEL